jgi:hypothetical protein
MRYGTLDASNAPVMAAKMTPEYAGNAFDTDGQEEYVGEDLHLCAGQTHGGIVTGKLQASREPGGRIQSHTYR